MKNSIISVELTKQTQETPIQDYTSKLNPQFSIKWIAIFFKYRYFLCVDGCIFVFSNKMNTFFGCLL